LSGSGFRVQGAGGTRYRIQEVVSVCWNALLAWMSIPVRCFFFEIQDTSCRIQDTGYRIQDAGFRLDIRGAIEGRGSMLCQNGCWIDVEPVNAWIDV